MIKTYCDICGKDSPVYKEQLLTLTELGNPHKQTYELCLDCVRNIADSISQYINEGKCDN